MKPKARILLAIAALALMALAYSPTRFFINYYEAKPVMGLLRLASEEYFSKDNHKSFAEILEAERYSPLKSYAVKYPTNGNYLVKVKVNKIFIIAAGKNRQIFWLQKDDDSNSQNPN